MKTSQHAGPSALDDAFGSLKEEGAEGGGTGAEVRVGDMPHSATQQQRHFHNQQQMQRMDRSEYGEQMLERNYAQRQQRLEQVHKQHVEIGRAPPSTASPHDGEGVEAAVVGADSAAFAAAAPAFAPAFADPVRLEGTATDAVPETPSRDTFFSPLLVASSSVPPAAAKEPPSTAVRIGCRQSGGRDFDDEDDSAAEPLNSCAIALMGVLLIAAALVAGVYLMHSISTRGGGGGRAGWYAADYGIASPVSSGVVSKLSGGSARAAGSAVFYDLL